MDTALPQHSSRRLSRVRGCSLSCLTLLAVAFATACGGSSSQRLPSPASSTLVTVFLTSTGNDELSQFDTTFESITLTNKSGKTVSLLTPQLGPDFIHVNGLAEPWTTVSVPQDVYTAATVTLGNSSFTCVTLTPTGSLDVSTFAYINEAPPVTVNVPAPITIAGTAMGLSLDLQVSSSATYPGSCYVSGIEPFSITPTFDLTPVAFSSEPTDVENGKEFGLLGQISSVDTTDDIVSLVLADGQPLTVNTVDTTVFQGIAGLSTLAKGMFVDMDAAVQANGTQVAARIAVYDPTAVDVMTGPLLYVSSVAPCFNNFGSQQQGSDYSNLPLPWGSYGTPAGFEISEELQNVSALPFDASFSSANMVPGQNVAVSSQALTLPGEGYAPCGNGWTQATTVTLMPQTIDGTVSAVSSEGSFSTYTVTLAPYDLFPALAVQPGQASLISDPSSVVVYVDSSTQLLNSQPLAVGSIFRFNGLVFNDNGTLRMDCRQVNDGVSVQQEAEGAVAGVAISGQRRIICEHLADGKHRSGVEVVFH